MQRGAERVGVACQQLPDQYLAYRAAWVSLLWNLATAFGLPEGTVHHALALLDVAMASGLSCGGEQMMRLVATCCLLLAATALNQTPHANGVLRWCVVLVCCCTHPTSRCAHHVSQWGGG